jgi:hypothetical protein
MRIERGRIVRVAFGDRRDRIGVMACYAGYRDRSHHAVVSFFDGPRTLPVSHLVRASAADFFGQIDLPPDEPL